MHKILLADDDEIFRATVRALLEKEFKVVEAADGREAVEAARRQRPGLILLDVTMPVMSGLDALAAIRAEDPSATVVMLTGQTDIDKAQKALELGAVAYVTKPFDPHFLRAEVRHLLSTPSQDASGQPWTIRP